MNLVERSLTRFMRSPPTVARAARTIVVATAAVVVIGGILMRTLDHSEYSNVWVGMWWALETVTTVGYGDVTPKNLSGRLIASAVMLEGIAFLAIITAVITSAFVSRASREYAALHAGQEADTAGLEKRLAAIEKQLDAIQSAVSPPS